MALYLEGSAGITDTVHLSIFNILFVCVCKLYVRMCCVWLRSCHSMHVEVRVTSHLPPCGPQVSNTSSRLVAGDFVLSHLTHPHLV